MLGGGYFYAKVIKKGKNMRNEHEMQVKKIEQELRSSRQLLRLMQEAAEAKEEDVIKCTDALRRIAGERQLHII